MSSPIPSDPRANAPFDEWAEPRRWIIGGLTALFVLIGVAILLSVMVPFLRGQYPTWPGGFPGWDLLVSLVFLLLGIAIVMWLVRLVVWGVMGGSHAYPYGRHYYRHYYRHYWGEPERDMAVEIARERFARGEISQEQFDQMLRQLGRGPTPVPPP